VAVVGNAKAKHSCSAGGGICGMYWVYMYCRHCVLYWHWTMIPSW